MFFKLLSFLLILPSLLTLDVYFVRHGARAPLEAPMQDIFGADPQQLTEPGRAQTYYYGQELRRRYPNTTSDFLTVYSTQTNRTKMSAEYFLKGWFGMNQRGTRWVEILPMYLPPSYIGFTPKYKFFFTDESEYSKQVFPIPEFEDKTGRTYGNTSYNDDKSHEKLQQKVQKNSQICAKFQKYAPGSCKQASVSSYFLLKDITRCLRYINKTVPNLTSDELDLLSQVVNSDYDFQFRQSKFPTEGVQQDFNLVQEFYRLSPNHVVVEFTHDTQLFHVLRSLLGIEGVERMFKGEMVMDFLSSIHYKLENNLGRIFFNDKEFYLPGCDYKTCSIRQLFRIMNS